MTQDAKRTTALLGALAVVAGVVAVDRFVLSREDDSSSGTRDVYAAEAALTAETRAVAVAGEQWAQAAQSAREQWDARRARMIEAPSAEIAAARLRAIIQQVLLDEGITLTTSETLPSVSANESGEIVVIGLAFSFEASDPAPVYRVLDRVEHLPDTATHIDSFAVRGPGRMGGASMLSANARIRAVARLSGANNG